MADEKRIALVIGNAAYENASLLKNPTNDAREIANALSRIGFSGVSNDPITGLTNTNATLVPLFNLDYKNLRRALALFSRATEATDQAVIYYAGHGIEVGGRNYLIPIDAKLEHAKDVWSETVALDDVLSGVEEGTGLRLVILDACRDNPFRSRMVSTRSVSRGLAFVEPPSNDILVAYSSKHGKVAMDATLDNSPNSPYASALLNYIERPGLEIAELFREVQDYVKEITGKRQEPHTYGQLGRRKYYFVSPSSFVGPNVIGEVPKVSSPQGEAPRKDAIESRITESQISRSDFTTVDPAVLDTASVIADERLGFVQSPIENAQYLDTSLSGSIPTPEVRSGPERNVKLRWLLTVGLLATIASAFAVIQIKFGSTLGSPYTDNFTPVLTPAPAPTPTVTPEPAPAAIRDRLSFPDKSAHDVKALAGDWCEVNLSSARTISQASIRQQPDGTFLAENFFPTIHMTVERDGDSVTMRDGGNRTLYHVYQNGTLTTDAKFRNNNGTMLSRYYQRAPCP
ncbi:caspase family protein [Frankia sp. RB7]|nr:caspase family protein [Frankia sp. RB7]